MTKPSPWQLLKTEDVSPSPYFPLEKRKYRRPDGEMVDDFYVAALADCAHIVPITRDGQVIMIRMFKQGVGEIVTQFPAGRLEAHKHQDVTDLAAQELNEETGIKVKPDQLIFIRKYATATTKSTEQVYLYLVKDVEVNSQQKLDDNEEIEVLILKPDQVEELIKNGEIAEGQMIADWYLVKSRYPELF